MAEEILRTAGFSQDPDEDMESQYMFFPGDPFFRYWREYPKEGRLERERLGLAPVD